MTNNNTGFTLIEVLITVVIMAIGLLGLAGLQLNSLRDNLSAEQRGKAAVLVYDMVDRMRSNIDLSEYTDGPDEDTDCLAVLGGCDSEDQAEHDVFEWHRNIGNSLPLGEGTITASGAVFSVTVTWDDNRDGNVDASDASFTARFQP